MTGIIKIVALSLMLVLLTGCTVPDNLCIVSDNVSFNGESINGALEVSNGKCGNAPVQQQVELPIIRVKHNE